MTPASSWLKQNCLPAALGCCGVQRIGHWEWWKAIDIKKSGDILKYRELILSWSMRFTLALFSEQCSVLCQNCCHGYQLINHLQVVLDVVSLFFFPQHNHWQSVCLFLNPHKWKILPYLNQNYSQTCIMRLHIKQSPNLFPRNHSNFHLS